MLAFSGSYYRSGAVINQLTDVERRASCVGVTVKLLMGDDGGIDSLESIPEYLKCLQIRALVIYFSESWGNPKAEREILTR
jgi:hypothetical protein